MPPRAEWPAQGGEWHHFEHHSPQHRDEVGCRLTPKLSGPGRREKAYESPATARGGRGPLQREVRRRWAGLPTTTVDVQNVPVTSPRFFVQATTSQVAQDRLT